MWFQGSLVVAYRAPTRANNNRKSIFFEIPPLLLSINNAYFLFQVTLALAVSRSSKATLSSTSLKMLWSTQDLADTCFSCIEDRWVKCMSKLSSLRKHRKKRQALSNVTHWNCWVTIIARVGQLWSKPTFLSCYDISISWGCHCQYCCEDRGQTFRNTRVAV